MTIYWIKYMKFHHKQVLVMAVLYTVFVSLMSGCHIYNLFVSSAIL